MAERLGGVLTAVLVGALLLVSAASSAFLELGNASSSYPELVMSPSPDIEGSTADTTLISPIASAERSEVNVISLRVSFGELKFETEDGYDIVKIDDCGITSLPGEPTLPAKTIIVLLPPDNDVSDIEASPVRQVQVEEELDLYPGQESVPVGMSPPEFTPPNEEVYSSLAPYPGEELCKLEFVTGYRGYKLAVIRLFPIRYIPAERSAIFYQELEVRVKLEPSTESRPPFHPTPDVDEWVRTQVKNPEFMDLYSSSRSSGNADYLIITRQTFLDEGPCFGPFIEFKSQRMTVEVVTVEDIVDTYPGRDVPEQIRNCIIDYYNQHGTQWVLLAGDADHYDGPPPGGTPNYELDKYWELPTRYVWNPASNDEQDYTQLDWHYQPTDFYYAALDGTWDTDNDNLFGEREFDSVAEEADWFAEVYVGRVPATDAQQLYYSFSLKTVGAEGSDEICLFGANLGFSGHGWTLKEHIKETYLLPEWPNVHEYYSRDGTLSEEAFINAINTYDPMVVNAAGHGSPYGIYYDGERFVNNYSTPDSLTQDGFSMYAMACLSNAFDFRNYDPCVGEAMILASRGAIGYIGGTRIMWGSAYSSDFLTYGSIGLDVKFFEEVFQKHEFRQGAALYESKINYIASGWYRDFYWPSSRANLFVTLLLGDPEFIVLPPENQPFSEVNQPEPYWHNDVPFTVTAKAFDVDGFEDVALWYRYSSDNSGWSEWQEFGVDEEKPWEWLFTAPEGEGYYEFYSIATDKDGNVEQSPAEADAAVGVDQTQPPVPTPVLPGNNALFTTLIQTFIWSSVADFSGVTYDFVVDDEPTFSESVKISLNLVDNFYTIENGLLLDGLYFWRVRAVDGASNPSNWSDVWQFEIRVGLIQLENFVIAPARIGERYRGLSTGFGDGRFFVTWVDWETNSLVAKIYDNAGNVLVDTFEVAGNAGDATPWVAFGDGKFFVSWFRGGGVYAKMFDSIGQIVKDEFIVCEMSYTKSPSVAFGDGRFFVTWQKYEGENRGVFAIILDNAGNVLDNAFLVAEGPGYDVASVAFGDGVFFVTWSAGGVYGKIYLPSGIPVSDVFQIATGSLATSLVKYSGGKFLVSWGSWGNVYAKIFDRWGDVIRGKFTMATNIGGGEGLPGCYWVSSSDDRFFVTWVDYQSESKQNIHAKIYGSEGNVLTSEFSVTSDSGYWRWWPSIASGDNAIFIAWPELYCGTWEGSLCGATFYYYEGGSILSISPAVDSVVQGDSCSAIVAVNSQDPDETLYLSASELPSGATVSFDPPSGDPPFSSVMTISTSPETPLGTYEITVWGVCDNKFYGSIYSLDLRDGPSTPELISPRNGKITGDNTPTFRWTGVEDPSGVTYTLQYSRDNTFQTATTIRGLSDNTYTVPDNEELTPGRYYWRVRAIDGTGDPSDWSEVWWFKLLRIFAIELLTEPHP